jgi:uncharacterized Zn finger protein (UPF0148 family)
MKILKAIAKWFKYIFANTCPRCGSILYNYGFGKICPVCEWVEYYE